MISFLVWNNGTPALYGLFAVISYSVDPVPCGAQVSWRFVTASAYGFFRQFGTFAVFQETNCI